MSLPRYRVVVGFEVEASSADEAYQHVFEAIGKRNAERPDSPLRIVLGPKDETEVYQVGGSEDGPEVAAAVADLNAGRTRRAHRKRTS